MADKRQYHFYCSEIEIEKLTIDIKIEEEKNEKNEKLTLARQLDGR